MITRKLEAVIEHRMFKGKAIIQNFSPLALRQDTGSLWESKLSIASYFSSAPASFTKFLGNIPKCCWKHFVK